MFIYIFAFFLQILIVTASRIVNELTSSHDFKINLVFGEFLIRQNDMVHFKWGKGKSLQSRCIMGNCYYESLLRVNKAEESLSRCTHFFIKHAICTYFLPIIPIYLANDCKDI